MRHPNLMIGRKPFPTAEIDFLACTLQKPRYQAREVEPSIANKPELFGIRLLLLYSGKIFRAKIGYT